jgi:carbon storage regulator
MLVLTRKAGQSILVGDSVRITVIELSPGVVRLGFEAPQDVPIYREEVYKEIETKSRPQDDGSEPAQD